MSWMPGRRLRYALVAALLLGAALVAILVDASAREAARDDARQRAAVALVGLPDLMLSSSSRWLRHPSQSEPGAALSDLPGSLDTNPGGALLGPPRAILRVGGVRARRRAR
jgi:hypothetical protein